VQQQKGFRFYFAKKEAQRHVQSRCAPDAKKSLWARLGENASQGPFLKDGLLDELVLIKTDIGLK